MMELEMKMHIFPLSTSQPALTCILGSVLPMSLKAVAVMPGQPSGDEGDLCAVQGLCPHIWL